MAGRVAGKGITLTGAGSGRGPAFAHGFAREGALVGVLGISNDAVAPLWAQLDYDWPERDDRRGNGDDLVIAVCIDLASF
jgi:NAD(P)-dependent dehydrogenase (short-subunit alcohol dehydrogenase family)